MKISLQERSGNPKKIARIKSAKVYAGFVSCTDMWTAFWLAVGLFITLMPVTLPIVNYGKPPPPPGAGLRIAAFIAGYWLLTTPVAFPRLRSTFRIARNGIVLAGWIAGYAGANKTRIEVKYSFDGKTFSGRTGTVVNQLPAIGSKVLIAIDPKKPKKYRVMPNDFRVESYHLNYLREILEIESVKI